jgi:3-oxoacyl-[acyl-carrier-protein] synthase II
MPAGVVITGLGMVTPLGFDPCEVLRRLEAGETAALPAGFDPSPFACPVCASVRDFQPQLYLAEPKMLRLMNRDAQLAVAAAHLALRDARLRGSDYYRPEEMALFGATGTAGLPLAEVGPLMRASTAADGRFDLTRFGQAGLRAINPLLSFKVLGNMPVCFVSICENLQGPNAVYTPWEGQGAQAIMAGVRALQQNRARCALVGGCDVKTHELGFLGLQQQGLFRSWQLQQPGLVPAEGAVYLVLENETEAAARQARVYARVAGFGGASWRKKDSRPETYRRALAPCGPAPFSVLVSAADGDPKTGTEEGEALAELLGPEVKLVLPKPGVGNLFAAAAALQVGLGALLAHQTGRPVLANCFGPGSEQAAFRLEKP